MCEKRIVGDEKAMDEHDWNNLCVIKEEAIDH